MVGKLSKLLRASVNRQMFFIARMCKFTLLRHSEKSIDYAVMASANAT
ncbi:hypothetical protein [uncultured Eubacterium sp.]|nr:hypothetical protein [uncultured Eubacterium sp.]